MFTSVRGAIRPLGRLFRPAACAALCASPFALLPVRATAQALAVGGPVSFGQVATGSSSSTFVLTFFATTPTTITSVAAVTQGSAHGDFAVASQDCAGTLTPPQSCQVGIVFTPSAPGLRRGALLVSDASGKVVNRVFLSGVGAGAQVVFGSTNVSAVHSVATTPSTFLTTAAAIDGGSGIFFNDVANSRLVFQPASGTASTYSQAATTSASDLALSGDGTLFYSRPDLHAVYAVASDGTAAAVSTGSITLSQPTGLAVDADGFLYIADAGTGSIVRVAPDGSGSAVLPLVLPTPLSQPGSLAVDQIYLYIADDGNNRLVRVSLTSTTASVVATSLSSLGGLAVDAAGTVLAVNRSAPAITAIPATGTPYQLVMPANALNAPEGIALQGNGDLVVADAVNGLVTLVRSTGSYTFPTATTVGSADATDGTRAVTVISSGTNALQLASGAPALSSASFSAGASSSCPIVSASTAALSAELQPGSTCTYAVAFAPNINGAIAGSMTVSGAAVGNGGPASGSVNFNGTGLANYLTFSINAGPTRVPVGSSVGLVIEALLHNVRARGYLGTVILTSTDPAAVFTSGSTYSFTAADQGLHAFPIAGGVQFNTVGTFTVTITAGTVTNTSNAITVTAPASIQLASSGSTTMIYNPVSFTGALSGSNGAFTLPVTLLDGATEIGTGTVQNGVASVNATFSTPGTHTLTLAYPGDNLYSPATSNAVVVTVGDFGFAPAAGGTSVSATVAPGAVANFNFTVVPSGAGTLLGPVVFAVQGLPAGVTASFSPATLPTGSGTTAVVLSLNTANLSRTGAHAVSGPVRAGAFVLLCGLLFPLVRRRRHLRPLLALLLLGSALSGLTGCLSDSDSGYYQDNPQTLSFTVTASSGPLVHSAGGTLNVQ